MGKLKGFELPLAALTQSRFRNETRLIFSFQISRWPLCKFWEEVEFFGNMVTLLDLPWEDVVCKRILNRLSVTEICTLKIVSKQFLELVETYFRVCRELDLSICGRKSNFAAKHFESLANECESLRGLTLNGCKRWLHDKILIPVVEGNLGLRKIDLSGCLDVTDLSVKILVLNCKFMQEIILAECRWLTSDGLLVVGLECSYLKVLVLRGCWNVDNESLSAVLRNNASMELIDIGSCYSINGATITDMAKFCTDLKHIDISGCWRVGNDAIFAVREYCKAVKTLMVKDCRGICEKSLGPLRRMGVKIDVPKPPEYQRPILPFDYRDVYRMREPFLNLQV